MAEKVTLKGVKSGIVLRLPEGGEFESLLPGIEDKFKNAAEFLGSRHLILSIEGRNISEQEAGHILVRIVHYFQWFLSGKNIQRLKVTLL